MSGVLTFFESRARVFFGVETMDEDLRYMEKELADERIKTRPQFLEQPTSIIVTVEQHQRKKIEKVAGIGNRSLYIRWLIDSIDEENVKREMKLEFENRILKRAAATFESKLKKKDQRIDALRRTIKALKDHKPMDLKDYPGIDEVITQYTRWKSQLESNNITVGIGRELDWGKIRAKQLDVDPRDLLAYIHQCTSE